MRNRYADDEVVIAENEEDLQQMLNVSNEQSSKISNNMN